MAIDTDPDVSFFEPIKKKEKKPLPSVVTNELLDRLEQVESGGRADVVNKQSGAQGAYQFMPDTVKMLRAKGIKFDPFNKQEARNAARVYLQQLVDQNQGDIEKALAQYGGHIKADPTNYVNMVMGRTPIGKTKTEDEDVSFFTRPTPQPTQPTPEERILNQAAFGIYPRISITKEAKEKLKTPSTEGLGTAIASMADIVGNAPSAILGPFGYLGLRAMGRSPEVAQKSYEMANLIANPVGKLTGLEQTPEYQQSQITAPFRQLGAYTQQKAKEISQAYGVPESDVEAALNLGMMATPLGAKAIPPVVRGVGDIYSGVSTGMSNLRQGMGNVVQRQMAQQFAQRQAPQAPTMQSGGAMAAMPESVLRANIDSALANASPELQTHIRGVAPQKVNIPALETRALEEKHGVNLLSSQRTGDLQGYTEAWNNRLKNGLISDFEQQPKQLANAFEESKRKHAPDISSTADASELGQLQINALANKDALRQQAISNAYKALEDANGGQFPIDTGKLKQNIDAELFQKYKSRYLSEGISGDLEQFLKNPTFEGFEALRTNLADEMRSAKDGKTRQAAYIVREQLEKLPIFGEEGGSPQAIQLKALADNARKLYAERQRIIASNPAYKAAVKEASSLDDVVSQGESLNAAKFHEKFVSRATPEAIRRMKAEIPSDDVAQQAITFAELERAKRALVNANESRIKTDVFGNFIRNNKSVLRESLSPEAMQDVMEIGLLNSKIGKPEAGGFNYSNSYTAMIGDLAKQGLLTLGEAKLAGATSGLSVPVTGVARQFVEKFNKDAFANSQRNPLGGLIKE